jgi:peptidoglycan/LPS O-acetylase OafA/YrhL
MPLDPETQKAAQTGYIPVLDGLRAMAILLVLAAHAGLDHLLPGAFGVTLFFFISGYLITRQLLGGLERRGHIGLGNFYARRVLRLAPAGLAYVAIAGLAYDAAGGHITPAGWLSAIFYGANIYDLWEGYRSTLAGVRHPFNILWSLAIEEHFYALWPLILGLFWRARWAMAAVFALCVAVLCWRVWLFGHCTWHFSAVCGRVQTNPAWRYNRLYQGTDTRIDSIAWGALLALAEHRRPLWVARAALLWPAALVLLAASFLPTGEFARQVLRTSVQGVALLALFPALLTRDSLAARALCTRPALWIGRLSYSLYLWHWGAFALADWLAGPHRAAWLAIGLPLAALFSAGSYAFIEQPMLRLRRRIGSHPPPPVFLSA